MATEARDWHVCRNVSRYKLTLSVNNRERDLVLVLGIGLKNQNRLIGNSEQSIIDYNRFSACFVRKTEYSFLPNIITVVFR